MATLYFRYDIENITDDWAYLGNWFLDPEGNTPSPSLPTSSDTVIILEGQVSNSGSEPTVAYLEAYGYGYMPIAVTVTGLATLNDYVSVEGVITGNCVFNDYSYTGGLDCVVGNATFNDDSSNSWSVVGDCTFNHRSRSESGAINGNATFNDSTYNTGTIGGDATFRDSSYSFGEYAVISGTVTFTDRTPYPIPRGINGSSILGVI